MDEVTGSIPVRSTLKKKTSRRQPPRRARDVAQIEFQNSPTSMKFLHRFLHQRADWNVQRMLPFLKSGEKVLDFGCGDMSVALRISHKLPVQITGMEVVDYRIPEAAQFSLVPYTLPLPFKDNEFDVVLAAFVLHHIRLEEQEKIIKELYRVAGRSLVILEDVHKNSFERLLLCVNDYIGNRLESSKVPVPYAFRSENEWKSFFEQCLPPHRITVDHFHARYGLWRAPHAVFAIGK